MNNNNFQLNGFINKQPEFLTTSQQSSYTYSCTESICRNDLIFHSADPITDGVVFSHLKQDPTLLVSKNNMHASKGRLGSTSMKLSVIQVLP